MYIIFKMYSIVTFKCIGAFKIEGWKKDLTKCIHGYQNTNRGVVVIILIAHTHLKNSKCNCF